MRRQQGRAWIRRAGGVARLAILVGSPLLLGCSTFTPGLGAATAGEAAGPEAERLGSFEVASLGAPPGTIAPAACVAGDHELFLGADLVDPDTQLVVRLVIDPLAGPAVRVYDSAEPFDRSVLFFRDECPTFQIDLEETGEMINNVVVRSLELELECENEDGATIRGSASATRCD